MRWLVAEDIENGLGEGAFVAEAVDRNSTDRDAAGGGEGKGQVEVIGSVGFADRDKVGRHAHPRARFRGGEHHFKFHRRVSDGLNPVHKSDFRDGRTDGVEG